MKTPAWVSTVFLMALMATPAHAHDEHSHGVASLDASVSGDTLALELEIPLDSLLGFERVPKYDKDLAKVREVAAQLRQGEALFVPTPAAGCKLAKVKLESDVIAPELLGEAGGSKPEKTASEHADLDVEYSFKCAKPGELKSVEVKLFDGFKRLRLINARVATDKGQRAAKLSSKSRTLSW